MGLKVKLLYKKKSGGDMNIDWIVISSISQGLEALIVGISAIAIIRQVSLMRQESGKNVAEAMSYISRFVESEEYTNHIDDFLSPDNPAEISYSSLSSILGHYDHLSYLIDKGYFDKEILFRINSPIMYSIKKKIDTITSFYENREPDNEIINKIIDMDIDAYRLICEGQELSRKRDQEYYKMIQKMQ
jgi:hypothetical protein